MNNYVTGSTIKLLREKKEYTQRQLAEKLMVSDKAVSKWESGRGLPDISLIEPLAKTLGVSLAELLSGECVQNTNRHGNMLRSKFYVCPVCGNVIFSAGEGVFSCCGVQLPPLEAEQDEDEHKIVTETIEGDLFVSMQHPMEKTHFISFFALVTADRVQIVKLYPEQDASARFPVRARGLLYAYCNRHGLVAKRL
ncbi:MAG TPA: helix-turn-helix domain-containing protein [Clostridia bacterium]|nr:helix-turn-helix domain-containing protein [Clostridia bacterium]